MSPRILVLTLALLLPFSAETALGANAQPKRALLIAGRPSHAPGDHEHNAGVLLLQQCLRDIPNLVVDVSLNGFPADLGLVDRADTILIYADGGDAHPALEPKNFAALQRAMQRRAGLVLLHYATEPTIENGETEFLAWVGGAFEINWSVNPHWTANFNALPDHPVTRGVAPFSLLDEWYFHLRFASGVTPLLAAVPPLSTMQRRDGPHSGNPHVRAAVARGEPQTIAWTFERPDGGRGFGLTGGHFHRNWGQRDFRTLVLNAILWTAQMDVPADGVASVVTAEDLARNLDPKP